MELDVPDRSVPMVEIFAGAGMEEMDFNLRDMLGSMLPQRTKRRKVKIPEAREILIQEESQRLIDMDKVIKAAIERVEHSGIIFLDEIDKIAGREAGRGPDVSREGVQRDLLPIVEGSTVNTKYGMVHTDHILFIASGAFHIAKPSDLIPELQGRFPIRVELKSLSKEDFIRILKEPENALIVQYEALLETEGVELIFDDEAIDEIAQIALSGQLAEWKTSEPGGSTPLWKSCSRMSPSMLRISRDRPFTSPGDYVQDTLPDIIRDEDLSRYILVVELADDVAVRVDERMKMRPNRHPD